MDASVESRTAVTRALAAYQEAEKEKLARLREADANRLVHTMRRFEAFFGCAADAGGITEDHKKAWFISGGKRFYYQFGDDYGWQVEGKCAVCGMEVPSPATNSLESLGRYLARFQPEYEHKDVCRAIEPEVPAICSAEEILLQALKDVIHNEIQDALSK